MGFIKSGCEIKIEFLYRSSLRHRSLGRAGKVNNSSAVAFLRLTVKPFDQISNFRLNVFWKIKSLVVDSKFQLCIGMFSIFFDSILEKKRLPQVALGINGAIFKSIIFTFISSEHEEICKKNNQFTFIKDFIHFSNHFNALLGFRPKRTWKSWNSAWNCRPSSDQREPVRRQVRPWPRVCKW